jgi:hypothetical protein
MHFSSSSCGISATAIKPDANGSSSSLKTGTLRPTVVRRAAIKAVPEGGQMHARKDKTEKRSAWLMELGRELRAEYADFIRTSPLSPRLAALLDELENAAPASRQQGSSVAPTSI